jgi:hypothetical protein
MVDYYSFTTTAASLGFHSRKKKWVHFLKNLLFNIFLMRIIFLKAECLKLRNFELRKQGFANQINYQIKPFHVNELKYICLVTSHIR